jgi:hypothetical protein
MKDIQATGADSSPPKKTFSTSKLENSKFFCFSGSFCLPGSGPRDPIESESNPDPVRSLIRNTVTVLRYPDTSFLMNVFAALIKIVL